MASYNEILVEQSIKNSKALINAAQAVSETIQTAKQATQQDQKAAPVPTVK